MEKVIKKTDFFTLFFNDLKSKYDIIGPTRQGGATGTYSFATFDKVERAIDLEMDYETIMLSPRKIFFPDNERLYGYEKNGNDVTLKDLREVWGKTKAIIGLHACDLNALNYLDKVLIGKNYIDQHYQDRRNKSILIGLTCDSAGSRCFCTTMGTGPDVENNYDLLLTDIGDRYVVRIGTDLGKKLISASYFRDASDSDKKIRYEKIEAVEKQILPQLSIDKINAEIVEKYHDKIWQEYATQCYTCGACNMVCPTCHCFTVNEKTTIDNSRGERVIIWDSCHFPRFAQIAGNVNLREEKTSRFKHRFYDKFVYSKERYGMISCVGCGRCAQFCPSHINVQSALMRF